jgi:hypothetical protein
MPIICITNVFPHLYEGLCTMNGANTVHLHEGLP